MKDVEQIALKHLLVNAYEEFHQGLHSAASRIVLWGALSTKDELVKNYFRSKGRLELIDKRRTEKTRNSVENSLIYSVENAANQAMEYVSYLRINRAQPMLREMTVSYCTLFENLLKNVALVYLLAQDKKQGIADHVFVPGDQFKKALLQIQNDWRFNSRLDFFTKSIVEKCPKEMADYFKKNDDSWEVIESAIKLRNAIVHQFSRPTEQETIGNMVFAAMQEIELSTQVLSKIEDAMRIITDPFSPYPLASL